MPLHEELHGYGYRVVDLPPVTQQDPETKETKTLKHKLLSFLDPQTGHTINIPLSEEAYKDIGNRLLTDSRIEIAQSLPQGLAP